MAGVKAMDQAIARDADAAQISKDLASDKIEADECTITVAGVELYTIAGKVNMCVQHWPN